MFNVGGGELLVILLIALIVLGPQKLPGVAKQVGGFMREVRKVSTGFQQELKSALDEPVEEAARERGNQIVSSEESPAPATDLYGEGSGNETVSSAAAAGMYDIETTSADDPIASPSEGDDGNALSPAEEVAPEPSPASAAEAAGMYDPEPELAETAGEDTRVTGTDE